MYIYICKIDINDNICIYIYMYNRYNIYLYIYIYIYYIHIIYPTYVSTIGLRYRPTCNWAPPCFCWHEPTMSNSSTNSSTSWRL